MRRSTIFQLIPFCFLCMNCFAQESSTSSFSLGFGRATYDIRDIEITERFNYPLGSSSIEQFGLYGTKAPVLSLGFHHTFNYRLSLGVDVAGFSKEFTKTSQSGAFSDGLIYQAIFEKQFDLKAASCRALFFFDYLKAENAGIKIGIGPTLLLSKLVYTSYLEGEFDSNIEFYLAETAITTRKASAVGASFAFRGDLELSRQWLVFLQGGYDWLKEDGLFWRILGVGYVLPQRRQEP